MPKPLTVWITRNCRQILYRWATWEAHANWTGWAGFNSNPRHLVERNAFQRKGNEPHKNSGTGFLGEFSRGLLVYRTLKYSVKRKDKLMHLAPTNEFLLVLKVSCILLGSTINNSTHLLSTLKGYHVWVGSRMRMEKAMAPHSSTLAWKIPWMEEPGRLQSMGLRRVGHDWATSLSLFTFMHWRKKWQPTPVFLPGESQGRGSLVGCHLWGRTESDTTDVT